MSRSSLTVILIFTAALIDAPVSGQSPAVPVRTDLAGDPLPLGAVARIGTTRFLPRPYLEQVFFTADGGTVIGRGSDNVLDFWEAETGKPVSELRDPDLVNFRADQSPDCTRLALYGNDKRGKPAPDTTLRVYDVATRKYIWTKVIDDEYHYRHAVRFSADGTHIITGTQLDLRVWDAKTGAEIRRVKPGIGYGGFTLSPDGKTVAICGETGLYLWNWQADGPLRRADTANRRYHNALTFSPDGQTIYTYADHPRFVHAYDVATGKFMGKADESLLRWRAVSPDGKTVAIADYDSAKREGSVILRDAGTGKDIRRLSSGPSMVSSGRWSKDGTRLAGGAAFRAWVWDVKTGNAFGPTVAGHSATVSSLTITTDGRLITSSDDSTVRAWDLASSKELARLRTGERVWQIVASPDGSLLAGSFQPGNVRVWDAKTGKEVFKLAWTTGRTGGVYRPVFSADDQTLLTYSSDFYMRSWDLLTGKLKAERRFRPDAVLGPEGDEEEASKETYFLFDGRIVELGTDGDTLVMGLGKDVAVYSLATGKERFKVEADERRVETLVLSPDGLRMVTAGSGPAPPPAKAGFMADRPTHYQVTVWDMSEAKRIARFRVSGSNFFGVLAFTPDGKRVVTGSGDEVLRFWDATSGILVGVIEVPRVARRVTFTPDGKRLAVGFSDPTILIYDLATAIRPEKKE